MDVLYLVGSVAGIAVLVGLNIVLFGRVEARADLNAVAARLALDVPGFRAGERALSRDQAAAIVENAADGSCYLARAEGDGLITRKLAPGTLKRLVRDGGTLALSLRDFTFPETQIFFGDPARAEAWETRLKRLVAA